MSFDYFMMVHDNSNHGSLTYERKRFLYYSVDTGDGLRNFGSWKDAASMARETSGTVIQNWFVSDWTVATLIPSPPQNYVPTGFKLGDSANFSASETVILRQVYDRINQSDCKDFINRQLGKSKVSQDFDLDKLLGKAVLNKWHSGLSAQGLGISQDRYRTIVERFAGTGAAVTLDDRTRIYLSDNIFIRQRNDSSFKFWSSHKDIDTASHLVHELFHIAGIGHPEGGRFDFDAEIKEHCGLANTHF